MSDKELAQYLEESRAPKSAVGKLSDHISGSHVMGPDGLRDYHAAREAVQLNRLKGGPEAKLMHVKKALKNHNVMVSYDHEKGKVRVHRPGVGDLHI